MMSSHSSRTVRGVRRRGHRQLISDYVIRILPQQKLAYEHVFEILNLGLIKSSSIDMQLLTSTPQVP